MPPLLLLFTGRLAILPLLNQAFWIDRLLVSSRVQFTVLASVGHSLILGHIEMEGFGHNLSTKAGADIKACLILSNAACSSFPQMQESMPFVRGYRGAAILANTSLLKISLSCSVVHEGGI